MKNSALDDTIESIPAIELVKKYDTPCAGSVEWLEDKTVKEAWETCERGDWMLWYYSRAYPNNIRELTLAKGHIAHTMIRLMKYEASIAAVKAAIAFGQGLIGETKLQIVCDAAYVVAEHAYVVAVALDYAVDDAVCAADVTATMAKVAARTADVTYSYGIAVTAAYARANGGKESADICRRYLKIY